MSFLDDDDADVEITGEPYVKVLEDHDKVGAASVRQKLEQVNLTEESLPAQIGHSLEPEVSHKREITPTRKVERQSQPESLEDDTQPADVSKDGNETQGGGWGLGGLSIFGSSLLSTATNSVTTLSHSVGEGFDRFVETVELSLGAEDPEEFAKREYDHQKQLEAAIAEEAEKKQGNKLSAAGEVVTQQVHGHKHSSDVEPAVDDGEGEAEASGGGAWLSGWGMSGLASVVKGTTEAVKKTVKETSQVVQQTSSAVQKTGKGLVSGGLDMLENIGKKTYDVLAEGDHGIKQTMRKEKPNLSQMLREAKQDAEVRSKEEEEFVEGRKAHFGAQFDDFQGLVQLEALEILSNLSEAKVHSLLSSLSPEAIAAVKQEMAVIKEQFDLKDMGEDDDEDKDHDFDRLITDHIGKLGLHVTPEKLISVHEKNRIWLVECSKKHEDGTPVSCKEVHESAIQSLAEITARSVEVFHKVAQLLLMEKNAPVSSFKSKATGLASGTMVLCAEVGILSTKFTQALTTYSNNSDNTEAVNPIITNVYLEATNSSTYIQDAFQLLLPVLQHATINAQLRVEQD